MVKVKRPMERRSLSRSATRALDVLELFGETRRPLRGFEISTALELHPSTSHQLLKTMVESAHLVFEARSRTYLPSPRLVGFGDWIVKSYGADERLRGLVADLQKRTGLVVTLTTPNDLFMQIIEVARPAGWSAERGLRISLFGSAIGSAYLSTLETVEVERLAQRARVPDADMESVFQSVSKIRDAGYADGPNTGNIWSMAIPLSEHPQGISMVLGVAGPREEVLNPLNHVKRKMLDCIEEWTGSVSAPPSA